MKITGNEPAIPTPICSDGSDIYSSEDCFNAVTGITIRQQFAMAAMQGIVSTTQGLDTAHDVARRSIKYADALISELNNTEK